MPGFQAKRVYIICEDITFYLGHIPLGFRLKVSDRTHGVEYAIRDIISYARKYQASGKEIIRPHQESPCRCCNS
jgi:hypothetical protein